MRLRRLKLVKSIVQEILPAGAAVSFARMEVLFATVANGLQFQNATGQNDWEYMRELLLAKSQVRILWHVYFSFYANPKKV